MSDVGVGGLPPLGSPIAVATCGGGLLVSGIGVPAPGNGVAKTHL